MAVIRISEGGPYVTGTFTLHPQDDQWGGALINGQTYDACMTFDGDGVIQMADNEVQRYQHASEPEVPHVEPSECACISLSGIPIE